MTRHAVDKVVIYITSHGKLLVFDHSNVTEAGTQVPVETLRKATL